jgi:hypothetical protein
LPPVDAAIFADTQWEPPKVYEWLNWLDSEIQRLPFAFPVYRVSEGNLRDDIVAGRNTTGGRFAAVPWFVLNPDGSKGIGRRQCTSEYKLKPLRRKMRELAGLAKGQRSKGVVAEVLIGISTDEALRMKPNRDKWARNVWPLIDANMSRQDCLNWFAAKGYSLPPKSSCIGCPFHSKSEWREIKADPALWADVLDIDARIRVSLHDPTARQFMHPKRLPMDQIDFSAPEEKQIDLFNNECEGLCGV